MPGLVFAKPGSVKHPEPFSFENNEPQPSLILSGMTNIDKHKPGFIFLDYTCATTSGRDESRRTGPCNLRSKRPQGGRAGSENLVASRSVLLSTSSKQAGWPPCRTRAGAVFGFWEPTKAALTARWVGLTGAHRSGGAPNLYSGRFDWKVTDDM
jgi:hypothetical protein